MAQTVVKNLPVMQEIRPCDDMFKNLSVLEI